LVGSFHVQTVYRLMSQQSCYLIQAVNIGLVHETVVILSTENGAFLLVKATAML